MYAADLTLAVPPAEADRTEAASDPPPRIKATLDQHTCPQRSA